MSPNSGVRRLLATAGALSIALLPHAEHLPAWITGAFAATVAWRVAAEQRAWAMPARPLRLSAALAAVVAVLLHYHTLNGLDAGTALLSLMAALKLAETRAPRDHAVLVFVGYLLCLATLLYGESPPRLAFVLLAVWLLTAALARVHRPVGADAPVRPFRLAGRLLVLGLPLAVILFLFVPRLEGRFWAVPARGGAVTGVGDDMSPGDVASLAQSDEPALRVWFEGPPPPPAQRYWRVQVLENFDGRAWHRTTTRADVGAPDVAPAGAAYRYRIALEPTQRPWLVGLDTVVDWPAGTVQRMRSGALVRSAGAQYSGTVDTRLDYELRSSPRAHTMATLLPGDLRQRDLELPAGIAPRARALAASLREGRDERAFVAAVLARFHDEPFEYTLQPPQLGADPTDEFLFATRQGFCEHYAAAFAVLTRAAGIPARVVVGYQGGEWNGLGDYLLITQASAHAWNEVWIPGEGWMRVDPTSAVAPERVHEDSRGLAFAGGGVGRALASAAWVVRSRQLWDAARTAWYAGVVNFDASAQERLLQRIGLGGAGLRGLAIALTAGFLLAALGLGAWLTLELRPPREDPLVAAWREFCATLAAHGLPRAAAEGPLDYSRRVALSRPALAPPVLAFGEAYVQARYLPGTVRADVDRVVALSRAVRARIRAAH
jgi:transglutaminase-like putative cysteine protease